MPRDTVKIGTIIQTLCSTLSRVLKVSFYNLNTLGGGEKEYNCAPYITVNGGKRLIKTMIIGYPA